jgi:four helix bundle protein
MSFDHQRLDVYQRALEVLDLADQIIEQMPGGRAHLKDQLDRASTSIVLNIAEGAGEFSLDEKCRFYRIARRSATEVAAILDIIERRRHGPPEKLGAARELLDRIVAMLVKMTKPSFRGGS